MPADYRKTCSGRFVSILARVFSSPNPVLSLYWDRASRGIIQSRSRARSTIASKGNSFAKPASIVSHLQLYRGTPAWKKYLTTAKYNHNFTTEITLLRNINHFFISMYNFFRFLLAKQPTPWISGLHQSSPRLPSIAKRLLQHLRSLSLANVKAGLLPVPCLGIPFLQYPALQAISMSKSSDEDHRQLSPRIEAERDR